MQKQQSEKRTLSASITTSKSDKDYLKKTIYDLSVLDEKTNQSELYALGLSLLRTHSPTDLQKLLHQTRERMV